MNPKEQIPKPEETLDEVVEDASSSVDDFIKELEAKEKDLHITADLSIEIEESEYDPRHTPDSFSGVDVGSEPPASAPRESSPTPASRNEPGMKTRVFELQRELDSVNQRVRELVSERNDIQDKSDRRLKDFERFKYRMDRERRGAFIDQIANLAAAMLPVLDNLDRALVSVDASKTAESPEFQLFYDGIALVNQQVNEVLVEMGVEPIKTMGDPFDPQFHEAVATELRDDVPNNTVIEEMLRGYRIGNRVVRHSMVKVTIGPHVKLADLEPTPAPDAAIEPAEAADTSSTDTAQAAD